MVELPNRRNFVTRMAKIMGSGVVLSAGGFALPIQRAFAQSTKDEIGIAWPRLACAGQSFVGEGAGHGAWAELMMRHQMFNAGAETVEALSAGVLEASYLGVTPAVAAISRGVPVKMYVGGHKRGMGLVARADSGIKSMSDLKGKNIATLGRGSLPDMQLRITAKEQGLDPDRDFNLLTLPSSDAVTALAKGSVHALMNCPEWPQVALTSIKGARFVVTDMDGTLWHGPETQCVVVIVKDSFAKENPRALKKLLQVHVKASRFMIDNPKEAAQIISKYEGAPTEATRLALSHMDITPVPSAESLIKQRDKMFEFGFTKRKSKVAEMVDLTPLREVLVQAGEKEWLTDLDKQIRVLDEVRRKEG